MSSAKALLSYSPVKVAAAIAEDLEEFPNTVRGTINPLYLAAAGAKGSDLYAIGEALSGFRRRFQDADCALVSRHTGQNGLRVWR